MGGVGGKKGMGGKEGIGHRGEALAVVRAVAGGVVASVSSDEKKGPWERGPPVWLPEGAL